jgi:Putative peptidoglycan binding domain
VGTETTPFVVRAGDHIEQIAHSFGVPSDAIRSEPANSGLVKKRGSLAMLAAGDILYVPVRQRTFLPVTTGSVNKFVAVVPEVEVHLDLTDDKGAIANAAYMVDGAGATIQGTTDGKGHVRLSVPMTARVVRLTLTDSGIAFEISVGGLDPIEETSGVQMRLAHLGFYGGPLDGSLSEHTRAGIKAFQAHEKLTVTGALDDATLSALKDAHGA